MNTGYVLWFAALVVVAGAALLWLAIGSVPEIPPDPGPKTAPEIAPRPASQPETATIPEPASEPAAQDGIAGPS